MEKINITTAFLLVIILFMCSIQLSSCAKVNDNEVKAISSDDCYDAEYNIVNERANYKNVAVYIKNIGDDVIEQWKLRYFDTDGDTIGDGDEIAIYLDPLNPKTFGYSDKDYKYITVFDSESSILKIINKDNTDYQMSIEFEGQGDILSSIIVRESAYSDSLTSDFVLGIMPEIIYKGDGDITSLTLNFKINDDNIDDEYVAEDLKGINKYYIFTYDKEEYILIPLETEYDERENIISATVTEVGTYCIIDMQKWFESLGFELSDYDSEENDVDGD